ncbi:MAG: hypothetical protein AB8B96_15775 [Lysobacterales bacterium]
MRDSYLFRVLLVPTSVFLTVLFGGSYGSGREVVEFVSSNGPAGGLLSLAILVTTHSILLVLSFELARLFRVYDYVSFCKVLLKRGWFIYEIVIVLGLVIALSITTTVGGTVLEEHFGIKAWIGSLTILGLIIVLNYFGREVVEGSMMLTAIALFGVLAVLVFQLLDGHLERVTATFAEADGVTGDEVTKGLMYAIGGGGYIPLLLYCAMGLRSRAEVITAALTAALVAGVPALIFHLAFMAAYPEVLTQQIPTYFMFEQVSTVLLLNLYVVIMFVLVAQTGVGVLHGLIERLDVWHQARRGRRLTRTGHAAIAGGAALLSSALGTMGVVSLILRGYTIMFASFIVVFVIPLLTYGCYLAFFRRPPETVE